MASEVVFCPFAMFQKMSIFKNMATTVMPVKAIIAISSKRFSGEIGMFGLAILLSVRSGMFLTD
jgi:hypothetical protein